MSEEIRHRKNIFEQKNTLAQNVKNIYLFTSARLYNKVFLFLSISSSRRAPHDQMFKKNI